MTDQYAEITASYRKLVMENVVIIDIELTNTLEDIVINFLNIYFHKIKNLIPTEKNNVFYFRSKKM